MIGDTFPDGYGTSRKTQRQIKARWDVQALDDEFVRRVLWMMRIAKRNGHDLGIGGGARSAAQQRALFLARHHVSPSGTILFEGQRWALNTGAAPAAPPGRSWHEDDATPTGGMAVDMVGDLAWMQDNAGWFGLRTFANVNGEPWHIQPGELPTARAPWTTPLPKWGATTK